MCTRWPSNNTKTNASTSKCLSRPTTHQNEDKARWKGQQSEQVLLQQQEQQLSSNNMHAYGDRQQETGQRFYAHTLHHAHQ